ncbi:TetR/AcrR family transcriptional regulator [Gloeobacter violaceus]|uniref:Glr0481 protein n=1 Tax=Gloeobacter violaceus (strain ATCC 29082 / PCC 7421) TaxID=251221 RepID=Q7NND0_GLOVI|nr:TetR/AcrR family transcriptional regulator [Gloeobacter violaceus]BAC88422.1 glr0481 [Gloeobacter violaceus PCC 7421]
MKASKNPSAPRSQITAAAYRLLAEKGYEAATMKEIAHAAGVAPGLIHYYFKSKDELLQEVLSEAGRRYIQQMQRFAEQYSGEALEQVTLAEPRERVEREPEWYRLRSELFALGLHHPHFKPAAAAMLAAGRECIGGTIEKIARHKLAHPPEAVAAVLLATFDGLATQKLADPDFDLEAAYRVLAEMFRSQLSG